MNLKDLVGEENYKDELTHDQINDFLKDKKFINLKDGKYVDKEKFTNLERQYNELVEKTKNYDSLLQENENFKNESKKNANFKILNDLNVDEAFNDYILNKLGDNFSKENCEKLLKENPKLLKNIEQEKKGIFFDFLPKSQNNEKTKTNNEIMNEFIRKGVQK